MSVKVQDNDLEIDENSKRSAASAPAPYLCKVYLHSVGASWVVQ